VKFLLDSTSGRVVPSVIEVNSLDELLKIAHGADEANNEIIVRRSWRSERENHDGVEWTIEIYDYYRE
jgi:hypothetical protein